MSIHNNLHFRASNFQNFQLPLEVRASCTQLFTRVSPPAESLHLVILHCECYQNPVRFMLQ